MPNDQSPHALGRTIIDGAFVALVLGSAVGSCLLRLPCQGRRLQPPIEEYDGPGWGCLEVPPPPAVVVALSASWSAETREAYAIVNWWWKHIPGRVETSGLFGEFKVKVAGGRGVARIERMGTFEDERRSALLGTSKTESLAVN